MLKCHMIEDREVTCSSRENLLTYAGVLVHHVVFLDSWNEHLWLREDKMLFRDNAFIEIKKIDIFNANNGN